MPRSKTTDSIDNKTNKAKDKIKKNKERFDALCNELTQLTQDRDNAQCKEILESLKKSRKSFNELMTILDK